MTHSRARKAPWATMRRGSTFRPTEGDLDYWQRLCASATYRWRTVKRFVARVGDSGAIYVERVA